MTTQPGVQPPCRECGTYLPIDYRGGALCPKCREAKYGPEEQNEREILLVSGPGADRILAIPPHMTVIKMVSQQHGSVVYLVHPRLDIAVPSDARQIVLAQRISAQQLARPVAEGDPSVLEALVHDMRQILEGLGCPPATIERSTGSDPSFPKLTLVEVSGYKVQA